MPRGKDDRERRRRDHVGMAKRFGSFGVGVRGVRVADRGCELADLLAADLVRRRRRELAPDEVTIQRHTVLLVRCGGSRKLQSCRLLALVEGGRRRGSRTPSAAKGIVPRTATPAALPIWVTVDRTPAAVPASRPSALARWPAVLGRTTDREAGADGDEQMCDTDDDKQRQRAALPRTKAEEERCRDQGKSEHEVDGRVDRWLDLLDEAGGQVRRRREGENDEATTMQTAIVVPPSKPNRKGAATNRSATEYSQAPCTTAGIGPLAQHGSRRALARLAVHGVPAVVWAVLLQLEPVGVVAPVLAGDVVAVLALHAGQRDLRADVGRCHGGRLLWVFWTVVGPRRG